MPRYLKWYPALRSSNEIDLGLFLRLTVATVFEQLMLNRMADIEGAEQAALQAAAQCELEDVKVGGAFVVGRGV